MTKEIKDELLEKANGGYDRFAVESEFTLGSYDLPHHECFYTNSDVINESSEIVCIFGGMVTYYYKVEFTCHGNFISLNRPFDYYINWIKISDENDINQFKIKYPYQLIFNNPHIMKDRF